MLLGAASVHAADLPVYEPAPPVAAPYFDWTGGYVGVFGGYGWGDARASSAYNSDSEDFYNIDDQSYSLDPDGFFAGLTAGYNMDFGGFVLGVEGELGYLGLDGSAIDPNNAPDQDTRTRFEADFYGALYARAGAAFDRVLIYGKGGVAFLNADARTVDDCIGIDIGCGTETLTMTGDDTMVGWMVGAGIEWALTESLSVKGEYAYFDFGDIRTSGEASETGFYTQKIDLDVHTVKVGLNYRFGGGAVSAAY